MRDSSYPLKILLVDDHAVVRAGYRRLLENSSHHISVFEADTGEQAYARYTHDHFDLVVMDLTCPESAGWRPSGASLSAIARRVCWCSAFTTKASS